MYLANLVTSSAAEIYRYSKERYEANFKKFLENTRIFERFARITPINQNKPNDVSRWAEEVIVLSNQPLEARIKEREDSRMEMKSSFRYDLKCLHDDSSDCIHVGFALALPQVRKVLNK